MTDKHPGVPILGHSLSLRLPARAMRILDMITESERRRNPRASRTEVATSILLLSLNESARVIYVADNVVAVLVTWGAGKAPLIGPVRQTNEP